MRLSEETINQLQSNPSCIRNICILAHVDHGKTSLSDSLLATNGIISQRMAGKVRYLDSREDEQLRGITMESSAISLYFKMGRRKHDSEETEINEYLINLIDSPGHIDFSSEVSTSSRLCDGAVVLVDAVEGVCSQTVNVLRQCWIDKLKPVLVINKIDRLILEWKLTPLEAYQHISRVIEQVNSVIGSFFAGDRMEDDMIWRESGEDSEFIEKDDEELYFTPEKNNVIFASAIDGWAFTVNTFSRIYAAKLGFSHNVLTKTLWGDFYLDMKNKKIIPGKKLTSKQQQQNLKPLFVSLILEQIWAVYENCIVERNQDKLEKIIEKLGAKITPRDLRSKDYKNLLNMIMSQWIPISHAILGTVIDYLPSPIVSQSERIEKVLNESIYNVVTTENDKSKLVDIEFDKSIRNCDSSDPDHHTLAYVSKLLSIPNEELPKDTVGTELTAEQIQERGRIARELAKKASEAAVANQTPNTDEFVIQPKKKDPFEWEFEEDDFEEDGEEEEDEEEVETETLVAFTRLYSGSLTVGQTITVVGPKYDASLPNDDPINQEQITHDVEIKQLYLIMGRELVKITTVPAGNIVGVVGLDKSILKNGTLTSKINDNKPYINLASSSTLIHNKPIMKIAVEPTNLSKLGKLERGLDLLAKADPVLEWYIDDDSGELIMCVAGELHLERCLKDLEERFAKGCDVTVKEPVIPFKEGLADNKKDTNYDESDEESDEENTLGISLEFNVSPLSNEVTKFLINHESEITELTSQRNISKLVLDTFKQKLIQIIDENKFEHEFESSETLVDNLIAFGPKRIGPNLFVESPKNNNQFRHLFQESSTSTKFEFENNVLNGFQLASNEGPLAAEPLQGVIVTLKKSARIDADSNTQVINLGGRIITYTRDLIHKDFLSKSRRLLLAMYTCDIQASTEVLGKVYAVVQKRGGTIISEEMKEGTPFFTIEARIPVIEAFGFSEEIRKRTSGAASPQLIFDGFDILPIDPFWVPHTEEELEELGEFAERENIARRYMNNIRRRKGLFVDEKVVKNAEKQRTLKKD